MRRHLVALLVAGLVLGVLGACARRRAAVRAVRAGAALAGAAPAPAGVDRICVPMALDGPARALVHALKFRGAAALARAMAAQIAEVARRPACWRRRPRSCPCLRTGCARGPAATTTRRCSRARSGR